MFPNWKTDISFQLREALFADSREPVGNLAFYDDTNIHDPRKHVPNHKNRVYAIASSVIPIGYFASTYRPDGIVAKNINVLVLDSSKYLESGKHLKDVMLKMVAKMVVNDYEKHGDIKAFVLCDLFPINHVHGELSDLGYKFPERDLPPLINTKQIKSFWPDKSGDRIILDFRDYLYKQKVGQDARLTLLKNKA